MSKNRFYITTPIYYINDRPHIGHAYTTIVADVLARLNRIQGRDVTFLTGTDENSQKTVVAAEKSGESIDAYTNRLAVNWKETWQKLGISNTDFIRTTEERHRSVVEEIWKRINEKGDMYKGKYEGLYCKGHEAFMKESDLIDELCPDHKTKPERLVEENYFFRLSKYQHKLLEFYKSHPNFVVPESRFHEVKSFVQAGLDDLSISRETQKWGIPVPTDPKHVIYVWFDALINYISGIGMKQWEEHPADIQTVGKDIIRFHAIIWPAMLLSAGLPLPKQIVANGFFTVDNVKISKSLGNAIDPLSLAEKYGVDVLRYFLLREIPYGEDGNFSEEKLKERYNSDLANGLGNFTARVLTLAAKETFSEKEKVTEKVEFKIKETKAIVDEKIRQFKLHEALAHIWELLAFGDAYVNATQAWKREDKNVIFSLVTLLDNVAFLLQPFMPETAEKITKRIVWEGDALTIKPGDVLFPRHT
ncbi:MAG: methionine--tRNA ligase [Patescibacteria group bacterium]